MGEVTDSIVTLTRGPFNSAFEVGFRSIVMLAELFPVAVDLQRLVFYDYLLLHSGDVPDGPSSLHPATPYRAQEYAIRREMLQQGLLLMASRDLVEIVVPKNGIEYVGTEILIPFLDRMTSEYTKELTLRARWVALRFGKTPDDQLATFFNENIGRWGSEFLFMRDFSEELSTLAIHGQ
jgi:hypothetical protein